MRRLAPVLFLLVLSGTSVSASDDAKASFASELHRSMVTCDTAWLYRHLDVDTFAKRILEGLDAPDEIGEGAAQGVQTSLDNLCDADAVYRLLAVRSLDGEPTVLIAMTADSGINYLEFLLVDAPGGLRVGDIWIATLGDWMSALIRQTILPVVAEMNRSFVARLFNDDDELIDAITVFAELTEQMKTDPVAARERFLELPVKARRTRIGTLIDFQLAAAIGDPTYSSVLEDLAARHGDDPGFAMILIDHHFLTEDWDAALATLGVLGKRFEDDPYLDVLRGNVESSRGDLAAARRHMDRALAEVPEFEDVWWSAVSVSLLAEDHDETARLLSGLRDRFGVEFEDLRTVPEYVSFANSEAHRRWLAETE